MNAERVEDEESPDNCGYSLGWVGDRKKSIAPGASNYIVKPVKTDHLLSLMSACLYK